MNEDKFKSIDDLNKSLEDINDLVLKYFGKLEQFENESAVVVQEKIDDMCIRISSDVSSKLENKRGILVKYLHENYVASNEIISTFKPLIELNLIDLPSVINGLKMIINLYAKPYQTAIEFVTILTPKLQQLTTNIDKLAGLKNQIPLPPIPGLNLNKLNITMKPIAIDEVISGNV